MVVRLDNVSWVRDGKKILTDFTWHIKKDEHWVLFGPNGSGKTTILQLINGYTWPTKGKAAVLNNEFGTIDLRKLRGGISWVSSFLQDRLYPKETAEEIIISGYYSSIGLYKEPLTEVIAKSKSIMESLNCLYLASELYGKLSQGEKQKVLIARAMMTNPELLILDEPCTGLDVFSRENLLETINIIAQKEFAPTIIYVTHYVEEILPVFTKVMLLREGQEYMSGPIKEVISSANLTKFFNHPVEVQWNNRRPALIIK